MTVINRVYAKLLISCLPAKFRVDLSLLKPSKTNVEPLYDYTDELLINRSDGYGILEIGSKVKVRESNGAGERWPKVSQG